MPPERKVGEMKSDELEILLKKVPKSADVLIEDSDGSRPEINGVYYDLANEVVVLIPSF